MTEKDQQRSAAFKACPILSDYLATALQDLQYTESDHACDEGREMHDSGTIYDCPDSVFQWAQRYCERFMAECADNVEAATSDAETGLWLTHERIGSTLYLASVGHGVTFTDDGNAPCLKAMAEWARCNNRDSLYFGDDDLVYWKPATDNMHL